MQPSNGGVVTALEPEVSEFKIDKIDIGTC